ncbi:MULTISPECIES: type II toxin-antitoxin system HipA family toxin [unclassified Undibacterium]|uniref:type II toxin-antitoxin system HipA family toxin n=1 Tax=unclassified Undibacterium TaxID=2630295 RepID=UPI002AC9A77F|nr:MULTISPECIES: type II toxin-antitoxin system HipA family toxin [unclassified Undibacterium]MEB0137865.1 type II toxin-antitoxin system HipA family toxin [Undibacterium sp. CCC2.1]MEB0170944.1 type II toxin-antitoxin system HipA family toxin [Undibacterium sp. CCC1.1]MEB0174989.1 type II toxin-antitoxin system HipA family toxin [Undibacterium sp. CCC3.4]MEB0215805.1 type II toxin-antitoxin system HipA family toxin [Undibacterium sp. 5I2]WPX44795.1 type II toxin-antitoxin system HipA family t
MATKSTDKRANAGSASKVELDVCLGQAGLPVGKLIYVKDGQREFSQFAYQEEWLDNPVAFDVSPDLSRVPGYQLRRAPSKDDSCFFLTLADTEPDSWGRRLIARAHAKKRKLNPSLTALTAVDYLCAVDDFSRIGALRLRAAAQTKLRNVEDGKRATPPLLELEKMMAASQAVELSKETAEDLTYLQGKGTSLGGMRPKCSVLDEDGTLALGKFPSVNDTRSVTRGEVLALRLAKLAGIDTADARIVMVQGAPVAIIRRFDRTSKQARIPYMSGAALLQSSRNEEHAYTEVVDAMRSKCIDFTASAQQLWRRLVFNFLITNVDDHLQNIGFLYVDKNQWQLSPSFDLNPFPEKDRESKTWLSEDTGPITSLAQLLGQAARFQLKPHAATAVLAEVVDAVKQWRDVALTADVGLSQAELKDFAPAFEHAGMDEAVELLA